jgi:hypothetical protein
MRHRPKDARYQLVAMPPYRKSSAIRDRCTARVDEFGYFHCEHRVDLDLAVAECLLGGKARCRCVKALLRWRHAGDVNTHEARAQLLAVGLRIRRRLPRLLVTPDEVDMCGGPLDLVGCFLAERGWSVERDDSDQLYVRRRSWAEQDAVVWISVTPRIEDDDRSRAYFRVSMASLSPGIRNGFWGSLNAKYDWTPAGVGAAVAAIEAGAYYIELGRRAHIAELQAQTDYLVIAATFLGRELNDATADTLFQVGPVERRRRLVALRRRLRALPPNQ